MFFSSSSLLEGRLLSLMARESFLSTFWASVPKNKTSGSVNKLQAWSSNLKPVYWTSISTVIDHAVDIFFFFLLKGFLIYGCASDQCNKKSIYLTPLCVFMFNPIGHFLLWKPQQTQGTGTWGFYVLSFSFVYYSKFTLISRIQVPAILKRTMLSLSAPLSHDKVYWVILLHMTDRSL